MSTLIFAYNAFFVDRFWNVRYLNNMKTLTRTQVVGLLAEKNGRKSLRLFAEEIGVSAAYLSDVFRGNREPGPTILELLGVERTKTTEITYAKRRATAQKEG